MRVVTLVLVTLIAGIQIPLWIGKGGWLKVWDTERQLEERRQYVDIIERRNAVLAADVHDLQNGFAAVEGLARFELGLVRPNEIFFQIADPHQDATGVLRSVDPPLHTQTDNKPLEKKP